jgi:hypothetical protein
VTPLGALNNLATASNDRATVERNLDDYQERDQNRQAVLDRVGQKQIEPSLSERFCRQLEISDNLS